MTYEAQSVFNLEGSVKASSCDLGIADSSLRTKLKGVCNGPGVEVLVIDNVVTSLKLIDINFKF